MISFCCPWVISITATCSVYCIRDFKQPEDDLKYTGGLCRLMAFYVRHYIISYYGVFYKGLELRWVLTSVGGAGTNFPQIMRGRLWCCPALILLTPRTLQCLSHIGTVNLHLLTDAQSLPLSVWAVCLVFIVSSYLCFLSPSWASSMLS